MTTDNYPLREFEPRKLSKEEIEDPYRVIHDFFSYAHLPQIREALWEWLKLTASGSYHKQPRRDRHNLLYLYEKVELLVEAAHIIHRQRTNNLQSKSKEN